MRKRQVFLLSSVVMLSLLAGYSFAVLAKDSAQSIVTPHIYVVYAAQAILQVDHEIQTEGMLALKGVPSYVVCFDALTDRKHQIPLREFLMQWKQASATESVARRAKIVYDKKNHSNMLIVSLKNPHFDPARDRLTFEVTFHEEHVQEDLMLKHTVLYVEALEQSQDQ